MTLYDPTAEMGGPHFQRLMHYLLVSGAKRKEVKRQD
jgi:hypothetical protein